LIQALTNDHFTLLFWGVEHAFLKCGNGKQGGKGQCMTLLPIFYIYIFHLFSKINVEIKKFKTSFQPTFSMAVGGQGWRLGGWASGWPGGPNHQPVRFAGG
jgi:hypothetical protein